MLSKSSGGVFKVELDGCKAYAVLNAYFDIVDKGGCENILEVWHSK